jgi:hypothetical protein
VPSPQVKCMIQLLFSNLISSVICSTSFLWLLGFVIAPSVILPSVWIAKDMRVHVYQYWY